MPKITLFFSRIPVVVAAVLIDWCIGYLNCTGASIQLVGWLVVLGLTAL